MLEQDITEKRKERHAITQEDFTPPEIVDMLLAQADEELFTDFSKTFCDPSAGIGNIICEVFRRRLMNCNSENDIYNSLSTLYATELMQDNTEECRKNLLFEAVKFSASHNMNIEESKIMRILEHNIACADAFKWDYENWKSINAGQQLSLDL